MTAWHAVVEVIEKTEQYPGRGPDFVGHRGHLGLRISTGNRWTEFEDANRRFAGFDGLIVPEQHPECVVQV